MNNEIMGIANSFGLLLACIPVVALCVVQSLLFMNKAYKSGLELGVTKEQMLSGIRASVITAVGPSCAVGVGVVALMAIVGGPYGWLRLSDIGSLIYETTNINLALETLGVTAETLDIDGFVSIVWAMGLSCAFWQITVSIFAPSYDKVLNKLAKGDEKVLSFVIMACMVGIICKTSVPHLLKFSGGTYAVIVGAITTAILTLIIRKLKVKWLQEWCVPISMIFGMFSALLF